jgi:hypothetical protein
MSALRLFERLPHHPIVTIASGDEASRHKHRPQTRAIEALAEIDILVETTGKKRDSSFAYRGYIGKD